MKIELKDRVRFALVQVGADPGARQHNLSTFISVDQRGAQVTRVFQWSHRLTRFTSAPNPTASVQMAYFFGAVVAGIVVLLALKNAQAGKNPHRIVTTTAIVVVLAGLGAKGYSLIERGGVLQSLSWELSAGYRYPGAMIAVLVSLPILWRVLRPTISIAGFLDAGVLGVCAGMVVVRIGCFISGCCHGIVTDVPWATRYAAETSPWYAHRRAGLISLSDEWSAYGHPLQLYFLIAMIAIGVFLLWFRKHRQTFDGQLALIFMVLNGISKGALESVRFSYVPSLQVYSFTMAIIGVVGLVVARLYATYDLRK